VKIYVEQQADLGTHAWQKECYLEGTPPRHSGEQATPNRLQLWDVPGPEEDVRPRKRTAVNIESSRLKLVSAAEVMGELHQSGGK